MLGLKSLEGIVGIKTNSSIGVLYAIERGAGMGFLPTSSVALGAALVAVDLGVHHHADLWLTYHKEFRNSDRHKIVIDWLKKIFDPKSLSLLQGRIHPSQRPHPADGRIEGELSGWRDMPRRVRPERLPPGILCIGSFSNFRCATAGPRSYHFNSTPSVPWCDCSRGAELAVIVDVEARGVAQAERSGRAGIRAISAFADALHDDALGAEADGDRAEILRDVVDELAVGGEIQNLLIEDPVAPDLRADQEPRALEPSRRSP